MTRSHALLTLLVLSIAIPGSGRGAGLPPLPAEGYLPPAPTVVVEAVDSVDFPFVTVYFRVVDLRPDSPAELVLDQAQVSVTEGSALGGAPQSPAALVPASLGRAYRPVAPLVTIDASSSMPAFSAQAAQVLADFVQDLDKQPESGPNGFAVTVFSEQETGLPVPPWPRYFQAPLNGAEGFWTSGTALATIYAEQYAALAAGQVPTLESAVYTAYLMAILRSAAFRTATQAYDIHPFVVAYTDGENDREDAGGGTSPESVVALASAARVPVYTIAGGSVSDGAREFFAWTALASGGGWYDATLGPPGRTSDVLARILESHRTVFRVTFRSTMTGPDDPSSRRVRVRVQRPGTTAGSALGGGDDFYMAPAVLGEDASATLVAGPPSASRLAETLAGWQSTLQDSALFSFFQDLLGRWQSLPVVERLRESEAFAALQEAVAGLATSLESLVGATGWTFTAHQGSVADGTWVDEPRRPYLPLPGDFVRGPLDTDDTVTDTELRMPWEIGYSRVRSFKMPTTTEALPVDADFMDGHSPPFLRYGVTIGHRRTTRGERLVGSFVTAFPVYVHDQTPPDMRVHLVAEDDMTPNVVEVLEAPLDPDTGQRSVSISLSGPAFLNGPFSTSEPVAVTAEPLDLDRIFPDLAYVVTEDVRIRIERSMARDNRSLVTADETDYAAILAWHDYLASPGARPAAFAFDADEDGARPDREAIPYLPAIFHSTLVDPTVPAPGICWFLEDLVDETEDGRRIFEPRVKLSPTDPSPATDRSRYYIFRHANVIDEPGLPFVPGEETFLQLATQDRAANRLALRLPVKVVAAGFSVRRLDFDSRRVVK